MKYLFILDAELKGKKFKAGRKYELDEKDGEKFAKRGATISNYHDRPNPIKHTTKGADNVRS